MADRLADRLERRRLQARGRQIRRRRLFGGFAALLLLGLAIFLVSRGESLVEPGGSTPLSPPVRAGGGKASATHAGARPDANWKPYRGPVPILMYHVIGDPAGEVTYPDLYLSVSDFRSQVRWLAHNGYTAVTLDQVQDAWYDGKTLPDKPVVLSFDDGYLGQYTEAMPILRKQGWAGLLNLKAEGSDLSSTEVKKMIKAGWEVASHTITHPDLSTLDPASLEKEIAGSKRELQRDLGIRIDNFCYPAGRYDDTVIAAVKDAGYRGATTVEPGLATPGSPYELKRVRIDQGDGAEALADYLDTASP